MDVLAVAVRWRMVSMETMSMPTRNAVEFAPESPHTADFLIDRKHRKGGGG